MSDSRIGLSNLGHARETLSAFLWMVGSGVLVGGRYPQIRKGPHPKRTRDRRGDSGTVVGSLEQDGIIVNEFKGEIGMARLGRG